MNKVAIIGATNLIGRQAVEQFSVAGYEVLAAHYENVEVPDLPGVEYIFIQAGDTAIVEDVLEQSRIVILPVITEICDIPKLINYEERLLNIIDICEDLPIDEFCYTVESAEHPDEIDFEMKQVQKRLKAYIENADLNQQPVDMFKFEDQFTEIIQKDIASLARKHNNTIIFDF
ncbi:hypothetical protein NGC53_04260 [Aerococcus viridans]|uniref:hypothetical protein n=1 Tax=Aerococcus viridans TaxID=1377 RepID=UPI002DBE2C7C|nr:hypothetical protein [Aerococcus viridans]MEB7389011.1 hypothetical protein [Aerococcus viridans]